MKSIFDGMPLYRLDAQMRAVALTLYELKAMLDQKRQKAPHLGARTHIVPAIARQWRNVKGTVFCDLYPHPAEGLAANQAEYADWPGPVNACLSAHGSRAGIHVEMCEAEPLLACLVRDRPDDTFYMTLAAPIDGPTPAHQQVPSSWVPVSAKRLWLPPASAKPPITSPAGAHANAELLRPKPAPVRPIRGEHKHPTLVAGCLAMSSHDCDPTTLSRSLSVPFPARAPP